MDDLECWVGECRAALAQAERLAALLGRLKGRETLELDRLRIRIADLRSAIDALDALREPGDPGEIHPDWMKIGGGSPWCGPGTDA